MIKKILHVSHAVCTGHLASFYIAGGAGSNRNPYIKKTRCTSSIILRDLVSSAILTVTTYYTVYTREWCILGVYTVLCTAAHVFYRLDGMIMLGRCHHHRRIQN